MGIQKIGGAPCIYRGDWGKFGDRRESERERGGSNAAINRSSAALVENKFCSPRSDLFKIAL